MSREQEAAQAAIDKSKSQSTALVKGAREVLLSRVVQEQINGVLPQGLKNALTADRVARMAVTLVQGSEFLQKCSPISIAGAVIRAAQLGLVPDGLLGHAYLVPRRVDGIWSAQFQLGWRGAVALAWRTDRVLVRARVVRAGDQFVCIEGNAHRIEHARDFSRPDAPIIAAYAIATYPDGRQDERTLENWEIEAAKSASASVKSGKRSPWDEWPVQMAEKTAIHRLCKSLPLSTEVVSAVVQDDASAAGALQQRHVQSPETGEVDTSFVGATVVEEREPGQEG